MVGDDGEAALLLQRLVQGAQAGNRADGPGAGGGGAQGARPFTALADSPDAPSAVLTFTADHVGVAFHDGQMRAFVNHDFHEQAYGRLFLTSATHRDFDGPTDKVTEAAHYIFDAGGELRTRYQTYLPQPTLRTATSMVDVSGNYDVWPLFGRYESLLRLERG